MDRRLRGKKLQARRRLYGRTQPGLLLKHQIAVKTEHWDVRSPGFTEIDLVAHSGNSGAGEFGHTLNVTDIHSGWTESRAILGRSQLAVLTAIHEVEQALPFALRGVDCDKGSEFINGNLRAWCQGQNIQTDPRTALQEGRQCPRRAEELDARAQAPGLGSLRFGGGDRGHQRSVPSGTALVAESLSALGEAGEKDAGGIETPACLRCPADPAGARGALRVCRGRPAWQS